MPQFMDRLKAGIIGLRTGAKPFTEQGVSGFTVSGGYVQTPETNANLFGARRWIKAAEILSNVSIVAASVRYSLNLMSHPSWKADPASDKPEAKALAELVEEILNGADTSWSRIVRRMGMYRYHGFSIQEWVAKKRDDGKIGIQSIEARPQQTVTRWDVDDNGGIKGVVQMAPQTSREIYLPRQKLLYCVDDSFTDRPEGMGWFRHLVEPFERMQKYLKLETIGFERDLSGIPIGRAPISRINEMVKAGKLTQEQATQMVDGLKQFVKMKSKEPSTGVILDSEPYRVRTDTGEQVSSMLEWGLELLTGNPSGIEALGNAVRRLSFDMAMIIGTESILVGREGEGSRALSEDKSRNLYLTINSSLGDMAEAADRDLVTPLWAMNGLPDDLRPKLSVEDAAFRDVEAVARTLNEMAQAGAILQPDDPAIDDLRQSMGLPKQPEIPADMLEEMRRSQMGVGGGNNPGGNPPRENPTRQNEEDPPPNPRGGRGRAAKYDPSEPRDYHGKWTSGGSGSVLFEVAPNPDNQDLLDRWNALSDEQRRAITEKLSAEFAPQVLDRLGVDGQIEDAMGGFEGQINPSMVAAVDSKPFEVAGAIGDAFGQKAMVVMDDKPGEGLSPVGLVGVLAPGADEAKLREIQSQIGDLADGFTYHNDRVQILNFSGKDDAEFAAEIDQRLGGGYMVEHATVYSAYIEEKDYARPTSDREGNPWGQVSGDLRKAFSQRLEEELKKQTGEGLKRFDPSQPRDPAGTTTGGQWTSAHANPMTSEARAQLVADNVAKPLGQLIDEAHENQEKLRQIGDALWDRLGVEFREAPYELSDRGVKTKDSILRKVRDEAYAAPGELTDISRATFVIDSPEDGEKVVNSLAHSGTVFDKGWSKLAQTGYLDRKVYMKFPNGGVAELQLVPRGVQQMKDGIGHRLYEISRSTAQERAIRKAALRRQRLLYGQSLDGTEFEHLGEAA
jgi:hypothetical protein